MRLLLCLLQGQQPVGLLLLQYLLHWQSPTGVGLCLLQGQQTVGLLLLQCLQPLCNHEHGRLGRGLRAHTVMSLRPPRTSRRM